jgi:ABC-2 type transport system ATP-binding protein
MMTQSNETVIQTDGLGKAFGPVHALKSLDLRVPRHSIFGFLGPNGAGKTTTMKLLLGLIRPTSGGGTVFGQDIVRDSIAIRSRVGYLPQQPRFVDEMSARETLDFTARFFFSGPQPKIEARVEEMLDLVGLQDKADRPVSGFSGGERQRLGLALAQVNDPDLLILDEPTSGLDPNQIAEIRALIKEVGKEKTVILSTHILPEVQATCSRMLIISSGKLVADGTPDELRAREKATRYRLVLEANGTTADAAKAKLLAVAGVVGCEKVEGEEKTHTFAIDGAPSTDLRKSLFRVAVEGKWPLLELTRQAASLEDVFRTLTTGEESKSEETKPAAEAKS